MSRINEYQSALANQANWDTYLLAGSNLPGPRGNLELAQAAVSEGRQEQFLGWLDWTPDLAPENTAHCFLAFCGTWGLGRLIAEGKKQFIPLLQKQTSDPRWRVREAAAMALQTIGDRDAALLLELAQAWKNGKPLEQRAVVAGLCEPRLLKDPFFSQAVLEILDGITAQIAAAPALQSEELRVLRQALGYGWSVAVASCPTAGKPFFEKWAKSQQADVVWIVRENLKKNRLVKMDAAWVKKLAGS
jgi:hypothetical protein